MLLGGELIAGLRATKWEFIRRKWTDFFYVKVRKDGVLRGGRKSLSKEWPRWCQVTPTPPSQRRGQTDRSPEKSSVVFLLPGDGWGWARLQSLTPMVP